MAKSKKAKLETAGAMPTVAAGDEEWKTKSAFDDLMRAEEHKKNPELMAKVRKHARLQRRSIRSIQDMKDYAQEKYGEHANQGGTVSDDDSDGM